MCFGAKLSDIHLLIFCWNPLGRALFRPVILSKSLKIPVILSYC